MAINRNTTFGIIKNEDWLAYYIKTHIIYKRIILFNRNCYSAGNLTNNISEYLAEIWDKIILEEFALITTALNSSIKTREVCNLPKYMGFEISEKDWNKRINKRNYYIANITEKQFNKALGKYFVDLL